MSGVLLKNNNTNIKYTDLTVVLQEIPSEISLAFTITGCIVGCEGCHSKHTWNAKNGDELTIDVFTSLLAKYEGLITCVVFFGGEWYESELVQLLKAARHRNIKTALYTGQDDVPATIKDNLTFLKVGKYMKENGGLSSPSTNQKLFNVITGEVLNTYMQQ